MSDYKDLSLEELREKILEDGVIDADEVRIISERLYEDGKIDKEEADFLFRLNDATCGERNDLAWQQMFVRALTDHVINNPDSPGTVDHEEAEELIRRIERDGRLTTNEIALLNKLAEATTAPGRSPSDKDIEDIARWRKFADSAALIRALHLTIEVFQTATDSGKLFASAVRGAMQIAALDSARVLRNADGQWCEEDNGEAGVTAQLQRHEVRVLTQVAADRRTVWENGYSLVRTDDSPAAEWSSVASPILDQSGDVCGALCGCRQKSTSDSDQPTDITSIPAWRAGGLRRR